MSARTDGIYNGTWCAICETPFQPRDERRTARGSLDMVHVCCDDNPSECEHSAAATDPLFLRADGYPES